jgi:superfamily II DNA or RNA helicase
VLLVLATALGKTVIFSHLIKDFLPKGRIMVMAHREELITQAAEKVEIITGQKADIEMGQNWATGGYFKADIVTTSVQTMNAGMNGEGRMTRFDPNEFSLLVIDEAHHATSPSYVRVIEYFKQNPNLKVLGVTATPDRTDEEALGQIFDQCAFEYGIREGIEDGWLVPIEQNSVYVEGLDFSACRTTAGDLNGRDLANVMEFEENLHGIVSPTLKIAGDRKTLLFAASVAHAERMAEIFNRHRAHCARFVSGETPKEIRRQMFADYAQRRFQFLVNVGVATEGFDDPDIDVVALARPTKSRSLYTQMVGRGTRPHHTIAHGLNDVASAEERKLMIRTSTKPIVEIIDFVGNAGKHKLISTADVLGGSYDDDIVARAYQNAKKKSDETGKPVNMLTELQEAEREIRKESGRAEEARIRKHVIADVKFSKSGINPFAQFEIEPLRHTAWDKRNPATSKQLGALKKFGIEVDGALSKRHASQLMDGCVKKIIYAPCTEKQAAFLRKRGVNPDGILKSTAGKIISDFRKHGWTRSPNLQNLIAENNKKMEGQKSA